MEKLASWVKQQRTNKNKIFKAVVANYAADSEGVINFTTGGIKVDNPAYVMALEAAGYDEEQVDDSIEKYVMYTANEYTGRIAGLLAGISLDRSATYFSLGEVVSCNKYDDIDAAIDAGELVLFDERDGKGVKVGRGINSLVNFSAERGESFRYIKIVEALDLILNDIATTFKNNYIGVVPNTYQNKTLLVASILTYLESLKGSVLDNSDSVSNYVEIDSEAHLQYAKQQGIETINLSEQDILEINTGTRVYLRGEIRPVNAMEDLTLEIAL